MPAVQGTVLLGVCQRRGVFLVIPFYSITKVNRSSTCSKQGWESHPLLHGSTEEVVQGPRDEASSSDVTAGLLFSQTRYHLQLSELRSMFLSESGGAESVASMLCPIPYAK